MTNLAEKIDPTPETIKKLGLVRTEAGTWRKPDSVIENLAKKGFLGNEEKATRRLHAAEKFRADWIKIHGLRNYEHSAPKADDASTAFDRRRELAKKIGRENMFFLESIIVTNEEIETIVGRFKILNKGSSEAFCAMIFRLNLLLDRVADFFNTL